MNKRITIFAPELKDREEIGAIVEDYFKKEFSGYFNNLQFQKFYALNEPMTENQIGHHYEVLVIFDRRLCPKNDRSKLTKGTPYFKALKVSLELTKNLCDEKNIPYLLYEGEMAKKKEYLFIRKIENIKKRLEERLSAN
jgi:hypothetical protein